MKLFPKRISGRILSLFIALGGLILALNLPSPPQRADISGILPNLHEIHSISPQEEDFQDLLFLEKQLEGKQIVILGEATHYDGGTFSAKSRLVKFLHSRMGFDLLFWEAGRYDLFRLQNDSSLSPNSAVYDFWSTSLQTEALWKYIRTSNLKTAGIDIQGTGNLRDSARRALLFDYLSSFEIDAPQAWPAFYKASRRLRRYTDHDLLKYHITQKTFSPDTVQNELDSMLRFLQKQDQALLSQEEAFKLRTHLSYIAGLKNQLEYTRQYPAGKPVRMQWRDSLMFENFTALLNEPAYRDKKIILWCANVHAFSHNSQFPNYAFVNLGERIKQKYPNQVYTMLFTSFGKFDAENPEQLYNRSRNGSLEDALHQLNKPYLYLENTRSASLNPILCRVNQGMTYQLNLETMADGLFYIDANESIRYPEKTSL